MLLKLVVLVGLAIYFWPEAGLSFLALCALIPHAGLVPAVLLTVILVAKSWYGSAAIVAGLVAFNLIGNSYLDKKRRINRDQPGQI